jgi:nitroimidazol reductase NimA-like FMN-containing flavoprotein (pyridoxamine 5'-phosphate oxidase superfamily)
MSTRIQAPSIHDLEGADIRSILTRNHVGRIAFGWNGSIDIRPIHYVYSGERIYGRTSYGDKFGRMQGSLPAPVAFEVDEITSFQQWRSVIVHGDFSVVVPNAAGRDDWTHAVEMLRRVTRNTFTHTDPFPERDLIFAIAIRDMSGRVMR